MSKVRIYNFYIEIGINTVDKEASLSYGYKQQKLDKMDDTDDEYQIINACFNMVGKDQPKSIQEQ
jgi:hypothetical protein